MASEIPSLTDEELRAKLRSFNLRDGPITKTTRKLFEAKLARAMGLDKQIDEPSQTSDRHVKNTSEQQITNINGLVEDSVCVYNDRNANENSDASISNMFYGVCLQADDSFENISVFTDKTEALHCVKKNSGARFRAFSTRSEAEAFALGKLSTPSRQLSQELSPGPVEPSSEYKGPKRGEITAFRKLIEKGDVDGLRKVLYTNPKYLISSGDTPVVIQEGCHYNAMHVSAKSGHKDCCKLIIDTLNDDEFWKMMYPVNNHNQNNRRKAFLLDLYLNTPDKGGCDTPLHFACKFGRADVVEYLISIPGIERTTPNKDGKRAEQVICSRVPNCSEELRSRIEGIFQKPESVCVPILRSDDNCSSPKIGSPWSPNIDDGNYEDVVKSAGPDEPRYRIRAYAGPMSPQEAEKFCHTLRSPRATPEKQAKFRNIKRSDNDKGLERVARKLAKSQNVLWCEYWKFLDCFTDLSTSEGLSKLEEYLRDKTEAYKSSVENVTLLKTPLSSKSSSIGSRRDCLTGDDVFNRSESTPSSHADQMCEKRATPCSRTRNADIKNFRSRLNLDDSPEYMGDIQVQPNQEKDAMDLNCNTRDTGVGEDDKPCIQRENVTSTCQKTPCGSGINEQSSVTTDINSLSPEDTKRSLDVSNYSDNSLSGLISEFRMLNLSETAKFTPENSSTSSTWECSPPDEQDKHDTTIAGRMRCNSHDAPLFIEGLRPSKVDLDVFRTIKKTTIDPVIYPYISRWMSIVRSFSKSIRHDWPSPGSPRYHKVRTCFPRTWSC